MELYEREEQDIKISECIWRMVKHWRYVLLSAIIFAALFGALKYMKDFRALQQNMSERNQFSSESADAIRKRMIDYTGIEKNNMERAARLIDSLADTNVYTENASVMKLNPYNVERVTLQYIIKAEDNQSEISQIYKNCIFTENAKQMIMEASENTILPEELSDMITLVRGDSLNKSSLELQETANQKEDNVIYFTIRGIDREKAVNVSDAVKTIIAENKMEVSKVCGEHDILLVSENLVQGRDQTIVTLQNEINRNIYDINERIKSMKASMDEEQIKLVEKYQDALINDSEDVTKDADNDERISINKVWILLGAFFGIAVIFMLEVLFWFESGKLNNADKLQNDFNIPILGTLSKRKKHKYFGIIDNLIYRFYDRGNEVLTKEQEFQIILSRLILIAQKENINKIFLTGTVGMQHVEDTFVLRIEEELKRNGISLSVGGYVRYDSDSLIKMSEIGNAVIWEETGVSKYQNIIHEIMICKEQSVKILGSIVVNNE